MNHYKSSLKKIWVISTFMFCSNVLISFLFTSTTVNYVLLLTAVCKG